MQDFPTSTDTHRVQCRLQQFGIALGWVETDRGDVLAGGLGGTDPGASKHSKQQISMQNGSIVVEHGLLLDAKPALW